MGKSIRQMSLTLYDHIAVIEAGIKESANILTGRKVNLQAMRYYVGDVQGNSELSESPGDCHLSDSHLPEIPV